MHGIFGRRPQQVRDLHRLLRQRRPDLVHTTLAGANAVGRAAATLARVPVVTSLVNVSYGPEYLNDPQLKAWKVRALHGYDAATAWRVRRFHALTPHVAEVMARRLLVPRSRIDVIPRGRDRKLLGQLTPQRRSAVRQKLGLDRDQFVVSERFLDVIKRARRCTSAAGRPRRKPDRGVAHSGGRPRPDRGSDLPRIAR